MTLRGRILAAGAVLVLGPLLLLGVTIHLEMARRLREQYADRVGAMVAILDDDLRARSTQLAHRLDAIGLDLARRNDVRLVLDGHTEERAALLDWAGAAQALAGLDALRLQDEAGRILSSGHFRNDYDRVDADTPSFLLEAGEMALVSLRRPDGPFLALARADSLRIGDRALVLVGALELNETTLAALARDRDVSVSLQHGGGVLPAGIAPFDSTRQLRRELPLIAAPALRVPGRFTAAVVVVHSLEPMHTLLRGLDLRLAATWILVAAGTLLLAGRLSRSIARPLEDLAHRTARIDLETLDAEFPVDRKDEVGTLSQFLAAMTRRLRLSVTRLRDAERRATFGELARQVNHDLRNAFTPLRNVVRHLSEVAETAPGELPRVYAERRPTLDAGLGYLDDLATNWGRLSHRAEREACDAVAVVYAVTDGRMEADGGPVRVEVYGEPPFAWAAPVGLRRIIENLVANACECLEAEGAGVTVSVEGVAEELGPAVRIVVSDAGPGIPEARRNRLFDPFYTTKPHGSGLGLAIVRRIVSDFEGTIRVESEVGRGTRFIVTLPAGAAGVRQAPLAPPPPLDVRAADGRSAPNPPSAGTGGGS